MEENNEMNIINMNDPFYKSVLGISNFLLFSE